MVLGDTLRAMPVYLALLVAIVGAALYLVSSSPKAVELGRLAFAMGILAFLIDYARAAAIHLTN